MTFIATVNTELLAVILEDMAERVRCGDCFGGWIEFDCTQCSEVDQYTVNGAYRVGNREGQGGMRLIRDGNELKSMTFLSKSNAD